MKKLLITITLLFSICLCSCHIFIFNDDNLSFEIGDELNNYENKFYYCQLDEYEQTVYKSLYHACINNLDSIDIGLKYDYDKICFAIDSFAYEWPQYYWYTFADIYDNYVYITICPASDEEVHDSSISIDLENKALSIVNECKADNDYDTIKNIHDYLINNVSYVLDSKYNEDIRSALLYQETDCSGFAFAFQYLCNLSGIECYSVYGTCEPYTDEQLHQWNLIKLDNNYYYIDVTWDCLLDDDSNKLGISYQYFLATEEIMNIDHSLASEYTYPNCDDDSYYFLNMPGVYCRSFDKNELTQKILSFIKEGYTHFYFKCANDEIYQDISDWLYFSDGFIEDIYEKYVSAYYDLNLGINTNDDSKYLEFYYEDRS